MPFSFRRPIDTISRSAASVETLATFCAGVVVGLGLALAGRRATRRIATGVTAREHAQSPTEISARGWRRVIVRVWRAFSDDRIAAVAAGATFYSLLALFPAIGTFVALYGLFAHVEDAQRHIALLRGVLPEGGLTVVSDQIARLAATPRASLGLTFAVSLIVSLWSSNAGVKSVIGGLNVAYEEVERRSFLVLNLVSLAFTVGAILVALVTAAAVSAAPDLFDRLGLYAFIRLSWLRWPALLLLVVGGLSLLYRFGPSRQRARWRWITPGGAFAATGGMAMSVAFSIYVGRFGHFDKTYGPLGAVVGFMTWIWLSLIFVLLGAELNSELEQQTTADTSTH